MGILESARRPKQAASGRWIVMPRNVNMHSRRRNRIIRRRRQNFTRLLAVAAVSLVLAFVPRLGWMIWVHLATDAAVGMYVWRLLVYKRRERQRAAVVTELPSAETDVYVDLDRPGAQDLDLDAPSPRVVAK